MGQEMEVKPNLIILKKITDLEEWLDCVGLSCMESWQKDDDEIERGYGCILNSDGRIAWGGGGGGRGWPVQKEYDVKNVGVAR